MANVGIATATTVMLLASAGEKEALALAGLVEKAAANRLAIEAKQSAEFLAGATDHAAAEAGERVLMDAWKQWYARALESVLALPTTPAMARTDALTNAISLDETNAVHTVRANRADRAANKSSFFRSPKPPKAPAGRFAMWRACASTTL